MTPNRRFRAALSLVLAMFALTALAVSGCTNKPSYYSGNDITGLAAYGVQNGSVFDCYYVDDIGEVAALEQAGLCPPGSTAMAAPLLWRETNWAYYSSPAYYNAYIPVGYRSHYATVYVVSFNSQYSKQISTAESNAVYKTSGGKTVSGSSVKTGTLKFNSGNPVVHATAPAVIPDATRAPAKSVRGGATTAPPAVTHAATRASARSVRH